MFDDEIEEVPAPMNRAPEPSANMHGATGRSTEPNGDRKSVV